MIRRPLIVLAVALTCCWALLVPTLQASSAAQTLLVTFRHGVEPRAAEALLAEAGVRVQRELRPLPVYRVQADDANSALGTLRASPLVRGADVEGEQVARLVPNDALYHSFQWNMRRIGAEQAWDLRPSAPDVVVAVLDTGVDLGHPDLKANLVDGGYDFINDTPIPQDDESHGTAVAGIIGAVGNNQEGVAGLAWRAKILPIKALNARGRGPDSAMVRAIVYAVDHGAKILNISSTGARFSAALEEAVVYAQERGALIVAAAGNTGDQGDAATYPAAFDGVVAVGAVDEQDQVPEFSQRGSFVQLAAPGVQVASTAWPGAGRGQYADQSGTSIAAPHVSGVAALLREMRPDLSAAEIVDTLRRSADDLGRPGPDDASGAGVLNAARAVAAVRLGIPPGDGSVAWKPAALVGAATPAPPPLTSEARQWYFAEGSTNAPFDVWFALQNAGNRPVTAHFTFLRADGRQQPYDVQVPARSRASVYANEVVPNAEFGTVVKADGPVFVERSMYFGHDGHSAVGARQPSRVWYLAEGSTASPFETWVLLMNPGAQPAQARLTFMREDGSTVERSEVVPPLSRRSVYVNQMFTAAGFSTQVQSDQPIVVERAMYFDGGAGGHDVVGTQAPARTWYFAEGASRGGFDTWLLVQNPGSAPASTVVTFFTETGKAISVPLTVGAQSRATLYANQAVPNAAFGIRVQADRPVVAERAMYFAGDRAGIDATGVASPDMEWFLPEGTTSGAFVEQLALLNTEGSTATVTVDFVRQDGQRPEPLRLSLPTGAMRLVDVNAYAPDASVALRVTSDRLIVVERTTYFARPDGPGATTSTGLAR